MAVQRTPVQKARRKLGWFAAIVGGLVILNTVASAWYGGSWAPKLGLDLQGGTQLILSAKLSDGGAVSSADMQQAVAIIRQRVDASGVSESEVSVQGTNNIVVSIPDNNPDQETMNRIVASAKLDFREVWMIDDGQRQIIPKEGEDPENVAVVDDEITRELLDKFNAFVCSDETLQDIGSEPSDQALVTCDPTKSIKFILSPVSVDGKHLVNAWAGQVMSSTGANLGTWAVNMEFGDQGIADIRNLTQKLVAQTGVRNMFSIVLDGLVISYPETRGAITDGKPQITGSFTQAEAKQLADQLKFGSLPLNFKLETSDNISATLGQESLIGGLIAGAIGLAAVLIYSLFQYRTLGLVTFASLSIAAVLTYLVVTILSWRQGYRLSLAGVTGLIVAIGIIADSFIVYFERIRDELRDGRMLNLAVENGWKRAFRTIFASDAVNFLAAAVLFVLAVGNVQGFAFTLGLTTLIDLFVVSMFTHPLLQLLATTKFFGNGHPLSGLDPKALGAVYRGRAKFREPVAVSKSKQASISKEAAKRMSIAERKAAAALEDSGKEK